MTIHETIEKLRELHEKATPGEWQTAHWETYPAFDSQFIAEAHNALPALLEYIESLEMIVEICRRVLQRALRENSKAIEELDKP